MISFFSFLNCFLLPVMVIVPTSFALEISVLYADSVLCQQNRSSIVITLEKAPMFLSPDNPKVVINVL